MSTAKHAAVSIATKSRPEQRGGQKLDFPRPGFQRLAELFDFQQLLHGSADGLQQVGFETKGAGIFPLCG
jgi:hypothetical protein